MSYDKATAQGVEVITKDGKSYYLSPLDQNIKGAFVRHVKAKARRELADMREYADEDSYRESLRELNTSLTLEEYDWGGSVCNEALTKGWNSVYFMRLLLQKNHPTLTDEDILKLVSENKEVFEGGLQDLRENAANFTSTQKAEGTP